jgi:hypothetical protein
MLPILANVVAFLALRNFLAARISAFTPVLTVTMARSTLNFTTESLSASSYVIERMI